MFEVDRIFSNTDHRTVDRQWFFSAREGTLGPYRTRLDAEKKLREFIGICIKNGETGGRGQKNNPSEIVPFKDAIACQLQLQGDIHWV